MSLHDHELQVLQEKDAEIAHLRNLLQTPLTLAESTVVDTNASAAIQNAVFALRPHEAWHLSAVRLRRLLIHLQQQPAPSIPSLSSSSKETNSSNSSALNGVAERRLARLDIDLFGYAPLDEPLQLVRCAYCHLVLRPHRFDSHLARCAASRRAELAVAADFGRSASAAHSNSHNVNNSSVSHAASSVATVNPANGSVSHSLVVNQTNATAPVVVVKPAVLSPPTVSTVAATTTTTNTNTTTHANSSVPFLPPQPLTAANTTNFPIPAPINVVLTTTGTAAVAAAAAAAAAAATTTTTAACVAKSSSAATSATTIATSVSGTSRASLADVADVQRVKRKFDVAVDEVSYSYHSVHKQRMMPHEVFLNHVAELSVNRSGSRSSLNRLLTQVQMLEPQPAASYQYSRRKPLRSLLLSGFVPPTPRNSQPSSATSTTSSPDEQPLELETDALLAIAFRANT